MKLPSPNLLGFPNLISFVMTVFAPLWLLAQNPAPVLEYSMIKTENLIKIDGILDENVWKNTKPAQYFNQYFPYDTSKAICRTEVRLTYDDNFIYVAIKAYDSLGKKYLVPSLRRDFGGGSTDQVSVVFDPFQDRQNGFVFSITPKGVQREGLIVTTGEEDLDLSWDNKWYSEARIEDGFWAAEMAIPFNTLRFKQGSSRWNINFYRADSKTNERSTWTKVPRNMPVFTLAYPAELVWDKPLNKRNRNISLIPYLLGGNSKDFEKNPTENKNNFAVGADAKIAVTPSLNLDLTVNPDFSQVEVDRQVTNLNRFELFFPERRQFFLENADLFGNFGFENIRPFFSRRIGIARDASTGQNIQNPIHFGARLSGRLNKDWRIGVLTMQTAKDEKAGVPSTNYSVAVLQRRVFTRSNISGILVNKQADKDNYNRLLGLDYNLASADNKWTGKFSYQQSFSPNQGIDPFAFGGNLNYNTQNIQVNLLHQSVNENFNPEVGFTPRRNFNRDEFVAFYNFYPKSKILNSHAPAWFSQVIWNKQYGVLDYTHNPFYAFRFQNNMYLELNAWQYYTYLYEPFDPTNTGGEPLPANMGYKYHNLMIIFNTDNRKKLYGSGVWVWGEYFNGKIMSLQGSLNYRHQHWAILTLNYEYNKISLPKPYQTADLLLLGPRLDLTFSRNIFFTALAQYNSQIQNINVNARLQWRFKPVSDLFLVYTDNYYATHLKEKNRAFVIKLNYWFNL